MEMFAPVRNPASSRAQEDARVGDLGDVAEPADRMPGEQLALERAAVVHRRHHRLVQLGGDHSRHERVRADALGPVLDRDVVGQHVEPGLRDVVAAVARPYGDRADRAHVDDRAAAGLEQVGDRVLGDQERPSQVRPDQEIELLDRPVGDRLPLGRVDAGVVDDRVEPAERRGRRLDDRFRTFGLGHVADHRHGRAAGGGDPVDGGLGASLVAPAARHRRALGREPDRDLAADSARGAGDEGAPSL